MSRRKFLKVAGVLGGMSLVGWRLSGPILQEGAPLAKAEETSRTEEVVPSSCLIGKQGCSLFARKMDGRIVKLEGHPNNPRNAGILCVKGAAGLLWTYDPFRVKGPLQRVNPKGEKGEWQEVSWETALSKVGEAVASARGTSPDKICYIFGRKGMMHLTNHAFAASLGTRNVIGNTSVCSNSHHVGNILSFGINQGFIPDFNRTNYVLSFGGNLNDAGGPLCFMVWQRQIAEQRDNRGAPRVIQIDPRSKPASTFADEWIPIRPGTDGYMIMAMMHVMVKENSYDKEFLIARTNAPFLVDENGYFFRVDGKEQVFDTVTSSVQPADRAGVVPALLGEYTYETVDAKGQKTVHRTRTAFQRFADLLQKYTPENASTVTDIPAETIRRIAREFAAHCKIGSTIILEGKEYPFRPASVYTYRATSAQERGTFTVRALGLLLMLTGSVDVPGGSLFWAHVPSSERLDEFAQSIPEDVPTRYDLSGSKYYPLSHSCAPGIIQQLPLTLIDPGKYGVESLPEVLIIQMMNPAMSVPMEDKVIEGLKKIPFIISITPFMDDTADYLADIILPPCTYLERYDGLRSAATQYHDGFTIRQPVIPPMYNTKMEMDILMDIAEKGGFLFGNGGFNAMLNVMERLSGEDALDLNTRYTPEEITDRMARSKFGKDYGLDWFKENGVKVELRTPEKTYMRYADVRRFHFYSEILKRTGDILSEKNIDQVYKVGYDPLPEWHGLTCDGSPQEYDLHLITYKVVEHKQSRTANIPLLIEVAPENAVLINARTAKEKGVRDGDEVWVETHNALTNETRKLKIKASVIEGIKPDVIAISAHYGHWGFNPWSQTGTNVNRLFFSGEGYTDPVSGAQSFVIRARIQKR